MGVLTTFIKAFASDTTVESGSSEQILIAYGDSNLLKKPEKREKLSKRIKANSSGGTNSKNIVHTEERENEEYIEK